MMQVWIFIDPDFEKTPWIIFVGYLLILVFL